MPSAEDFYPRSPCGERRKITITVDDGTLISIHALLAESDFSAGRESDTEENFYPRSPCGERHQERQGIFCEQSISIHALLAESDSCRRVSGRAF